MIHTRQTVLRRHRERQLLLLLAVAVAVAVAVTDGCTPACPDEVPAFSDDPEGRYQWHLPATGAPEAWGLERGDGVVVAVIDNGFDLAHPDLATQLWTNPDEVDNGLDDDGNGYVDDLYGWDFLDGDPDAGLPPDSDAEPRALRHGTTIAGTIAAATDNGEGVAGSCPDCRLMLLRGRDFVHTFNVMPILGEAIRYAVDNGARVISISDGVLDGELEAETIAEVEAALEQADAAGVVVVASAGNEGDEVVKWPARVPTVVAVAAVDHDSRPTSWTSFGAEVDVSAPGTCVFSTSPEDAYDYFGGTSASAPIVAGLAALEVAAHPTWSPAEIVQQIRATASPIRLDRRPGLEGGLGAGVVDFAAAVAE
jgi:subtilisin family serine protease